MSSKLLFNNPLDLVCTYTFTENVVESDWIDLTQFSDYNFFIIDCDVTFSTSEWLTLHFNNNNVSGSYSNISGVTFKSFLTFVRFNNKFRFCDGNTNDINEFYPLQNIKFGVYYPKKGNKILSGSTIKIYAGKFTVN